MRCMHMYVCAVSSVMLHNLCAFCEGSKKPDKEERLVSIQDELANKASNIQPSPAQNHLVNSGQQCQDQNQQYWNQ